jgi:hypothetical protein
MTRRIEATDIFHVNGAKRTEPQAQSVPATGKKERATFQLPIDLIEKVRDAVYWTPGATMAGFMEDALRAHIERTEKKNGRSFPSRSGKLKTGRPIKTR